MAGRNNKGKLKKLQSQKNKMKFTKNFSKYFSFVQRLFGLSGLLLENNNKREKNTVKKWVSWV
jgi:hypothetical protein